jgi:lipoprotein-anchoring transpeptidase ErfK/SrfK
MKTTTLTRSLPAFVLAALVGLIGLASAAVAAPPAASFPTATPTPTAGPPAAAVPTPTPTPTPGAAPTATMSQVEQKLAALNYDVGPVDGQIDEQAASAIMAFQKVYGLARTGTLTDEVTAQIMGTQAAPGPLVPNGEPNRVEVSLARQVLFLYEGGALTKILPVSSGTAETPTPTGSFRFYRSDPGWHTSSLGRLYNAQYFIGGYAIHGSLSVPAQPASHGCIRIPMSAAEWFPSHVAKGMQVIVLES